MRKEINGEKREYWHLNCNSECINGVPNWKNGDVWLENEVIKNSNPDVTRSDMGRKRIQINILFYAWENKQEIIHLYEWGYICLRP